MDWHQVSFLPSLHIFLCSLSLFETFLTTSYHFSLPAVQEFMLPFEQPKMMPLQRWPCTLTLNMYQGQWLYGHIMPYINDGKYVFGCLSKLAPQKIDPQKRVPGSESNSYTSCFGDFDPSVYQSFVWLCTVSRHYHGFKRVRHGVNSPNLKPMLFFFSTMAEVLQEFIRAKNGLDLHIVLANICWRVMATVSDLPLAKFHLGQPPSGLRCFKAEPTPPKSPMSKKNEWIGHGDLDFGWFWNVKKMECPLIKSRIIAYLENLGSVGPSILKRGRATRSHLFPFGSFLRVRFTFNMVQKRTYFVLTVTHSLCQTCQISLLLHHIGAQTRNFHNFANLLLLLHLQPMSGYTYTQKACTVASHVL